MRTAREVIENVTWWDGDGETEWEEDIGWSRANAILQALDAAGYEIIKKRGDGERPQTPRLDTQEE